VAPVGGKEETALRVGRAVIADADGAQGEAGRVEGDAAGRLGRPNTTVIDEIPGLLDAP
jgi:hypothetical protein